MKKLLLEDIEYVCGLPLPWNKLLGKSILVTGASGLLGSFFIDVIMQKNASEGLDCKILAVVRNVDRAKQRFAEYLDGGLFSLVAQDINKPFTGIATGVDYVIHLASNTHPIAYSTDPIGTITTNVIGLKNLLDFACESKATRLLFASSNEIYGENRGDQEFFDEQYCGYINSNTLRAGYPESKRCGEALCQAYVRQKGLDVVVARFTRSYGSTMLKDDSKAISQFIKKGIEKEDIVLKSEGNQYYSYTYVADAVAGLLTVLLKGESGEAYNIADECGDITLKDLAKHIADYAGTKVVFDIPSDVERAGYSTATKARLNGDKLKKLGWTMRYDVKSGIVRTIRLLTEN